MKTAQPATPRQAAASSGGSRLLMRKCGCGAGASGGGGDCEDCKAKKKLQRKPNGPGAPAIAPPIVGQVLSSGGSPLDSATRGFMESRLGHDFTGVRVHADARAAQSAREVNAAAYTVGRDVVFGAGQYAPGTSAGRSLLAHELTHVMQQRGSAGATDGPVRIADEPALEAEADRGAESAARMSAKGSMAGSALQRAPAAGWTGQGGKPVAGVNAGEKTVKGLKRIPIEGLARGNQDASPNATGQSAAGRAIVYLPDSFDATRSTQALIHFHGWGAGYRTNGARALDEKINLPDQIAADIASRSGNANASQLIAVLPEGNSKAKFGNDASGQPGFDTDGYINEVLGQLVTRGYFAAAPVVSKVMISGHSGSGEMINELMLGPGTGLPSKLGGVFLFDAVNGPNEFHALIKWLNRTLAAELASITALATDAEKLAFLADSMRFRLYASDASNEYYTKWAVGLKSTGKTPGNEDPIRDVLNAWFAANASALGGAGTPVHDAMRRNYAVTAVGHPDHEAVISSGDRMQESLATVQRAPAGAASAAGHAVAPASVHAVLSDGGGPLDEGLRAHAESRSGHDFSNVRVHTGPAAAESARQMSARAYAVGQHVVFGAGQYAPASSAGRALAMHELAHTVQQRNVRGIPPRGALRIGPQGDAHEREASRFASGGGAPTTRVAAPAIQRDDKPLSQEALRAVTCEGVDEKNAEKAAATPGDCIYAEPENCATYGAWVSTFVRLTTFEARATPDGVAGGGNTFTVIGGDAATRDTPINDAKKKVDGLSKAPKKESEADKTKREADLKKAQDALAALQSTAPPPRTTAKKLGEEFIDHPTDAWVKSCLPANLRATAYQLPADCADIAIILRHVWLAAHHRTEKFGEWVLGDKAGGAASKDVAKIIDSVGTGSVGGMLNPYTDENGKLILSWEKLQNLLHPGDVLVWKHWDKDFKTRTGGHTHTIMGVNRDEAGKVTSIDVLQGNEPIFGARNPIPAKDTPAASDDKGKIIRAAKLPDTEENRKALGESPGRRIETDSLSGKDFADKDLDDGTGKKTIKVWLWGDDTTLIAAGPAKAAARPATKAGAKRMVTDWLAPLRAATNDTLFGTFEAMLYETRAVIEGGGLVAASDARDLGAAAGTALWGLAKAAKDLGNESHFEKINALRAILRGIRDVRAASTDKAQQTITTELVTTLSLIDDSFHLAARGGSDIDFAKKVPKGKSALKILLTGFDPFNTKNSSLPPRKGEWNPSGAAVLALDGRRIDVDKNLVAVEGVVLPVSFSDFRKEIVERMLKPYAGTVDAVITVSLDPSIKPGDPVRLEHYAVGVHSLLDGTLEAIPAAGTAAQGPAIIRTDADLGAISAGTKQKASGKKPEIAAPVTGENITFEFADDKVADKALTALGAKPTKRAAVEISDPVVLDKIINGIQKRSGAAITFKVGTETFTANVVEGPGGNFLSNEVSYRVQRLLGSVSGGANAPTSFHVHTQVGSVIPGVDPALAGDDRKKAETARKDALASAQESRALLIATLERIVSETARSIVKRRAATTGGTP